VAREDAGARLVMEVFLEPEVVKEEKVVDHYSGLR